MKNKLKYACLIAWMLDLGIDVRARKIGLIIILTLLLGSCSPQPVYICADGYQTNNKEMVPVINRALLDSVQVSVAVGIASGRLTRKEGDSLWLDYQDRVTSSNFSAIISR